MDSINSTQKLIALGELRQAMQEAEQAGLLEDLVACSSPSIVETFQKALESLSAVQGPVPEGRGVALAR